ncbi:MAG: Ig-like domain-containing protein [Bacteroidetes bacterium]|nr:Ig-like domain-containing protein [Bacteroidota bacterium]
MLRFSSLISLVLLLGVLGCSKSSDPPTLYFNSLNAGGVGLGIVSPKTVPSNATIIGVLSSNIDPASATTSNIKLFRLFDSTYVDMTTTVSGNTITLLPKNDLGNGIYYELTFTGIRSTDGLQLTYLWRAFTTIGSFGPPGLVAYWNFENNTYDQQGNYTVNSVNDLNYAISFRKSLGQCAVFNGTSTIIQVANGDSLVSTNDFSLSFWAKANSQYQIDSAGNPKGQLVLGVADYKGFEFEIAADYSSCKMVGSYALPDGITVSEDLSFAGDGKTGANGGLPGWTYCADLTTTGGVPGLLKDKWAFITCTFNSASKIGTLYINGVMMKQQDFNQWPIGDPARNITGMKYGGSTPGQVNIFAMGFFHSTGSTAYSGTSWGNYYSPYANHFRGWLDEVRIFHSSLTGIEVEQMYTLTKP